MSNVMPKSGQFVAVWLWNGNVWSDTFSLESGSLEVYSEHIDDWRGVIDGEFPYLDDDKTRFITALEFTTCHK